MLGDIFLTISVLSALLAGAAVYLLWPDGSLLAVMRDTVYLGKALMAGGVGVTLGVIALLLAGLGKIIQVLEAISSKLDRLPPRHE